MTETDPIPNGNHDVFQTTQITFVKKNLLEIFSHQEGNLRRLEINYRPFQGEKREYVRVFFLQLEKTTTLYPKKWPTLA